MVGIATLFGKNGLQSWLLQRITAIILGAYLLAVVVFWFRADVTFHTWQHFVQSCIGRPCALAALLSLVVHSWIGIWTVTTDYIKITFLRLLIQLLCIGALMFYCYWGIKIIWL